MVRPEPAAPATTTREPSPIGARSAICFSVASLAFSATGVEGKTAGSSSNGVPTATSSADRPLIVSTRISDGNRSERRGARDYG